jgi:hypothetical protein
MDASSLFASLQIPQPLACEFFAVFSRFEFALKETGYFYVHRGRASPDWRTFAATIAETLNVTLGSDLSEAIDFLNREPPQMQISARDWKVVELFGTTPIATAIDAAQRVRHNLFHGGKHSPHSPPGRDERLVRAALAVLLACLAQDPALNAAYEQ